MSDKNHGEEKLIVGKDSSQRSFSERMLYHWEHSEKTGWLYKISCIFLMLFMVVGDLYFTTFSNQRMALPVFLFNVFSFFLFMCLFFKRKNTVSFLIKFYFCVIFIFSINYFFEIKDEGYNLYKKILYLYTYTYCFVISFIVCCNNPCCIFDAFEKKEEQLRKEYSYEQKKIDKYKFNWFVFFVFAFIYCFFETRNFFYLCLNFIFPIIFVLFLFYYFILFLKKKREKLDYV